MNGYDPQHFDPAVFMATFGIFMVIGLVVGLAMQDLLGGVDQVSRSSGPRVGHPQRRDEQVHVQPVGG